MTKHPGVIQEELQQKQTEETERACKLLHPLDLKRLVIEVAESIYRSECYPMTFKSTFNNYTITPNEALHLFNNIKQLILKFKEGNDHLFIVGFRQASEAANILPRLKNGTNIKPYCTFVRELSFKCVGHLTKRENHTGCAEVRDKLNEREMASLQYLSGHVIRKSYIKLRTSPSWRKPQFQQCIDLLSKFKISPTDEHRLLKSRDRGGLWYICKEGVEIFEKSELVFNNATRLHVSSLDYKLMVHDIMKNFLVKFAFRKIIENSNVSIEQDLSKDLLERLISLYLRIRCHSFAKDIREKHKRAVKLNKTKSLRKELKKKDKSLDI